MCGKCSQKNSYENRTLTKIKQTLKKGTKRSDTVLKNAII